jgi:hypothetical protein
VVQHEQQILDSLYEILPSHKHHIICGINAVTIALEQQLEQKDSSSKLHSIIVARADLSVPHLYSHLLTMAHLADVALLGLQSKGVETELCRVFGKKNVYAIGILKVSHQPQC